MSQKSCNFAPINIAKAMMKKYVLKILLLIVVSAICNSVLAATSTLTFTATCGDTVTVDDGAVWTITSDSNEKDYDNTKGIKYGNTSNQVGYIHLTTSSIPGTITQVNVTACGSKNDYCYTKVEVKVGDVKYCSFNTDINYCCLIANIATATFNGSASGEILVTITQAKSKSPIYCKSIEVTYEPDLQVQSGETITIEKAQNVNNLAIAEGGKIVLNDKKLTINRDLVLNTVMGSGTSGQIVGATDTNLEVHGNVFLDVRLGDDGNPNKWHAFTVPFAVDAQNGVYDTEGNQLTYGTDYAIMSYHGDLRANGQYGWQSFNGVMQPGVFYLMTVDGERDTYRFKKADEAPLIASSDMSVVHYTGSGTAMDAGWNGIGNPTLQYRRVNEAVQVLDPEAYVFQTKLAGSCNFVVGTPFFYQASENKSVGMEAESGTAFYAPSWQTEETEHMEATLVFGDESYRDYLYLSASEDAEEGYQIGRDLAKMFISDKPSVPQIAAIENDVKLSIADMPIANHRAVYELSLYAPQAGEYTLSADSGSISDLYLSIADSVCWHFAEGAYGLSLEQGENRSYRLVMGNPAPTTPTELGTERANDAGVQKRLRGERVVILRGGVEYDILGRVR